MKCIYLKVEGRSNAVAVEDAAIFLHGVDDIHGGNGLALGVLGEGEGVTHHLLQEIIDKASHVLVSGERDALHTSPPGESADGAVGHSSHTQSEFALVSSALLAGGASGHLACLAFACRHLSR